MALDATVYCDCLESGKVARLSADGVTLVTESSGFPKLYQQGVAIDFDHPDHHLFECEHLDRMLLTHRLGNISLIGLIRAELQREPHNFPILLEQVVYSGSHCGDWLSLETIRSMQAELDRLQNFRAVGNRDRMGWMSVILKKLGHNSHYVSAEQAAQFIAGFREQMLELSRTALEVEKPIVF
jgi:hypothetical protein